MKIHLLKSMKLLTISAVLLVTIFIACPRATTYQLHLDPNGGWGEVETTGFTKKAATAIPVSTGITKPDSNLAAWNTAADGSGTYYDVNQKITLTADLTLYAVWSSYGLAYTLINNDTEYSVKAGTILNRAKEIDVSGYWKGKTVTEVGDSAFYEYRDLVNIRLPSTITVIQNNAFYSCWNLDIASLPENTVSIGKEAFARCSELDFTSLPESIVSIGESAFTSCFQLALTSLPESIVSIGESAFTSCPQLALTSLPDGIRSIGGWAFANCSQLALTSLPSGLKRLEQQVFYGCEEVNLTSLPSGLEYIGALALSDTKSAFTTLPGRVTTLAKQAFSYTKMISMTIPASVTSIGPYLFYGNNDITEVTLEGNYSTLTDTFKGTSNLATVKITNDTTPATLSGDVFPSTVTSIKVPASAVDAYKTAWTDYASIISGL